MSYRLHRRHRSDPARDAVLGFTLVELMITVAIIGIIAAIAVQSFRPKADMLEVQNARLDIMNMVRKARVAAATQGAPIAIVPRTDGALGHRIEAVRWNDANNNWLFDGDGEVSATEYVVRLQGKRGTSGGLRLSSTFPDKAEIAGCNGGIGSGDPLVAVFLPNGALIDSAENVCTYRLYIANIDTGLASAVEVRPGGQMLYADSF